jgi:hypothetical protein
MSAHRESFPCVPEALPGDPANERLVLGALVTYPAETIHLLGGALDPALFASPACSTIFGAIAALLADGAPISIFTLTQKLRDLGQLENVGGAYEVTRLATEYSCTPVIAAYHLDRLRDSAALRVALETGEWLAEMTRAHGTQPTTIIAGTLDRMERIRALQDAGEASAATLGSLATPGEEGETELLRTRFLCRGGGLLLVGPTGVGKSSLGMQATTCWALGKPCFGIAPARPLRSIIVQAENDAGDLAEMRDGVFAGLNLEDSERERAGAMVLCFHEHERSGADFFSRTVEPLLRLHRPDLLWIDPALSYIAGESNSQADVGRFLRNWLNPLLNKYQCGAVVVHHTNKPPTGKEKSVWSGSDLAYLGSGSSEWANWARAVVAIRSLGDNGIFELCLGKRGGRVDWRNDAGERIYSTLIGHATEPGRIYWRNADESERPGVSGDEGKRFTVSHLLEHVEDDGMQTAALQRVVCSETGMSRANFYTLLKEAEKSGRIYKEKRSRIWQLVQQVQQVQQVQ